MAPDAAMGTAVRKVTSKLKAIMPVPPLLPAVDLPVHTEDTGSVSSSDEEIDESIYTDFTTDPVTIVPKRKLKPVTVPRTRKLKSEVEKMYSDFTQDE